MSSLREIAEKLEEMNERLQESEGEITEVQWDEYTGSLDDIEAKVDRCIQFKDHMEAMIEMYKKQKERAYKNQKVMENTLQRFKQYLVHVLSTNPTVEFNGTMGRLRLHRSKAAVEMAMPVHSKTFQQVSQDWVETYPDLKQLCTKNTVWCVDKKKVKEFLEANPTPHVGRLVHNDSIKVI